MEMGTTTWPNSKKIKPDKTRVKYLLDEAYNLAQNDHKKFISNDPIQFPHNYYDPLDRQVSAIITAWISFGNRKAIIKKAEDIHNEMEKCLGPRNYIRSKEYLKYKGQGGSFYRMFSKHSFFELCQHVDDNLYSLEYLIQNAEMGNLQDNAVYILKHFGNPGGVNKRLNMLLRWLVRKDNIDMGHWEALGKENLCIPLDVHVGNMSRKIWDLPMSNNIKTARMITEELREMDPKDPIKYDLSLFTLDFDGKKTT